MEVARGKPLRPAFTSPVKQTEEGAGNNDGALKAQQAEAPSASLIMNEHEHSLAILPYITENAATVFPASQHMEAYLRQVFDFGHLTILLRCPYGLLPAQPSEISTNPTTSPAGLRPVACALLHSALQRKSTRTNNRLEHPHWSGPGGNTHSVRDLSIVLPPLLWPSLDSSCQHASDPTPLASCSDASAFPSILAFNTIVLLSRRNWGCAIDQQSLVAMGVRTRSSAETAASSETSAPLPRLSQPCQNMLLPRWTIDLPGHAISEVPSMAGQRSAHSMAILSPYGKCVPHYRAFRSCCDTQLGDAHPGITSDTASLIAGLHVKWMPYASKRWTPFSRASEWKQQRFSLCDILSTARSTKHYIPAILVDLRNDLARQRSARVLVSELHFQLEARIDFVQLSMHVRAHPDSLIASEARDDHVPSTTYGEIPSRLNPFKVYIHASKVYLHDSNHPIRPEPHPIRSPFLQPLKTHTNHDQDVQMTPRKHHDLPALHASEKGYIRTVTVLHEQKIIKQQQHLIINPEKSIFPTPSTQTTNKMQFTTLIISLMGLTALNAAAVPKTLEGKKLSPPTHSSSNTQVCTKIYISQLAKSPASSPPSPRQSPVSRRLCRQLLVTLSALFKTLLMGCRILLIRFWGRFKKTKMGIVLDLDLDLI
ncbi:uncharacterized protein MYCFIDRAFT_176992 [Pseudocercospora fijiensis CIRAD86]|uniref:Uncharacterized protein n=1 Tax=Pseudocercospora fijiensis (strain CIRAD86) TaxID=383855 RepID=M2YQI9_PSEFD|nr:uncharacterized protein MYCFIDRAFT_176992 [Pseudocercospora fijiensis CIRAD86]EME80000.1 hypothetical protein MYCFIDRAFT_176992 [Pseudocercospora fijiensis CIRAD86]